MSRPKPNTIYGWHSPMLTIRAEAFSLLQGAPEAPLLLHAVITGSTRRLANLRGPLLRLALRAGIVGLLRWLWWCLPWYSANANGWGVRALGFYVNVIHGPYVCVFCQKATTQGPNEAHAEPAHCARCAPRLSEWSRP